MDILRNTFAVIAVLILAVGIFPCVFGADNGNHGRSDYSDSRENSGYDRDNPKEVVYRNYWETVDKALAASDKRYEIDKNYGIDKKSADRPDDRRMENEKSRQNPNFNEKRTDNNKNGNDNKNNNQYNRKKDTNERKGGNERINREDNKKNERNKEKDYNGRKNEESYYFSSGYDRSYSSTRGLGEYKKYASELRSANEGFYIDSSTMDMAGGQVNRLSKSSFQVVYKDNEPSDKEAKGSSFEIKYIN